MDSAKIVMLKNNQHIITMITELKDDNDNPLCFEIVAPLIVSYAALDPETEDVRISFTSWSPFSKSIAFRIPFDHVISIGEPKDDILAKYVEVVEPLLPESDPLEIINKDEVEEE